MPFEALSDYSHLDTIVRAILDVWPEHEKFLRTGFENVGISSLRRCNDVAALVLASMESSLRVHAEDYRWMCKMLVEERLYFARNKRYRRSTLEQAYAAVYADHAFMSRYLHGILLSQVCWHNHAAALEVYRSFFLPKNRPAYHHLEVGPGHGLLLAIAARDPLCGSLTGWDISRTSLDVTKKVLARMGIERNVDLTLHDIVLTDASTDRFDSIVCSEVLEHTEEPGRALKNIYAKLRSGGRVFLNVPINSPAPDHISLWRKGRDLIQMLGEGGFVVDEFFELPPTGKTLEQARRYDLDISCVIIAHRV